MASPFRENTCHDLGSEHIRRILDGMGSGGLAWRALAP